MFHFKCPPGTCVLVSIFRATYDEEQNTIKPFEHDSDNNTSLYLPVCSFDPADDPAVDPRLSEGAVGNSVRSFIYSATGAFMYQKYGTSCKDSCCARVRKYAVACAWYVRW